MRGRGERAACHGRPLESQPVGVEVHPERHGRRGPRTRSLPERGIGVRGPVEVERPVEGVPAPEVPRVVDGQPHLPGEPLDHLRAGEERLESLDLQRWDRDVGDEERILEGDEPLEAREGAVRLEGSEAGRALLFE